MDPSMVRDLRSTPAKTIDRSSVKVAVTLTLRDLLGDKMAGTGIPPKSISKGDSSPAWWVGG